MLLKEREKLIHKFLRESARGLESLKAILAGQIGN